jgi:hypothetical protein
MKRMAYSVTDRLFIVVYGAEPPTDMEWAAYLAVVERHGVDWTMQLIWTDGGGPTTPQRRSLNHLLDGRVVPVAVLSDSARVRGIATALSWFNRRIRAFKAKDLPGALAFLEIPSSRNELSTRDPRSTCRARRLDRGVRRLRAPPCGGPSARPSGAERRRPSTLRRHRPAGSR